VIIFLFLNEVLSPILKLPGIFLPPEPMLNSWATCLKAVDFISTNYNGIKEVILAVAARNIFGLVGRHFNVIITFFIMFVVIAGKEFLC
jgi:hypothetical protein